MSFGGQSFVKYVMENRNHHNFTIKYIKGGNLLLLLVMDTNFYEEIHNEPSDGRNKIHD
jgi:hypothetical protein